MDAFIAFVSYFVVALLLLVAFMFVYVKATPYNEFKEIANNNVAAAVVFAGAILGFTLPLAAAIFYTHDILEMIKWAAITGGVQLVVFMVMRRFVPNIEAGNVAAGVLLFAMSVSIGILNAICISS